MYGKFLGKKFWNISEDKMRKKFSRNNVGKIFGKNSLKKKLWKNFAKKFIEHF